MVVVGWGFGGATIYRLRYALVLSGCQRGPMHSALAMSPQSDLREAGGMRRQRGRGAQRLRKCAGWYSRVYALV